MTDHLAMVLVMLLFLGLLLSVAVVVGGGASLFRGNSRKAMERWHKHKAEHHRPAA